MMGGGSWRWEWGEKNWPGKRGGRRGYMKSFLGEPCPFGNSTFFDKVKEHLSTFR